MEPVQILWDFPHAEKISPYIQPEPVLVQFVPAVSTSIHHWLYLLNDSLKVQVSG